MKRLGLARSAATPDWPAPALGKGDGRFPFPVGSVDPMAFLEKVTPAQDTTLYIDEHIENRPGDVDIWRGDVSQDDLDKLRFSGEKCTHNETFDECFPLIIIGGKWVSHSEYGWSRHDGDVHGTIHSSKQFFDGFRDSEDALRAVWYVGTEDGLQHVVLAVDTDSFWGDLGSMVDVDGRFDLWLDNDLHVVKLVHKSSSSKTVTTITQSDFGKKVEIEFPK